MTTGDTVRKTKIVCTMGPKCWDEESMSKLIDAGMGVARFNFSHGDHEGHGEVLHRLRTVIKKKGSNTAVLLDTKGPEVRTAMLKDHQPIELEAGQDIIVYAAGPEEYLTWEGYKTPEETKIGCSYAKLCQSVKPGNRLLFADGSVVIEVVEILDEKNLKGKVLNSKKLGERKNGNLPGVKVELDVLQPKDIEDIKNFACPNQMDYIAVSFVQTGEDVKMVRKILDENGGENIQIISKIENEEGMRNFDDILKYTDGVMVARGDLGMEIPSEKVALEQKMMITKCNIVGKFCICATQMLESMCDNPLPTRAEMLDVANAVLDGADATMLSGETANGAFPEKAVATMAAIAANAEEGVDRCQIYNFIRDFTPMPVGSIEAVVSCAAKTAVDLGAALGCIVVFTDEVGFRANLASKYRPARAYRGHLAGPRREAHEHRVRPVRSRFRNPRTRRRRRTGPRVRSSSAGAQPVPSGAKVVIIRAVAGATNTVNSIPSYRILDAPGIYKRKVTRSTPCPDPSLRSSPCSDHKTVSLRATAISLEEVFRPRRPSARPRSCAPWAPRAGTRNPSVSSSTPV